MINYEDILKPAFYAYHFLNGLGPRELANPDAASFATRDTHGGVQALLWDFTITQPGTENDQAFYKEDHPAQAKGAALLHIAHLPAGRYFFPPAGRLDQAKEQHAPAAAGKRRVPRDAHQSQYQKRQVEE